MSVAVVDDKPGSGASSVAPGMLAPVTEVHYGEEELLRLNIASSELYPSFIAELEETSGLPTGYERCGTVIVARDADDNAELEHIYAFQRELGLEVERLRSAECRELEPALTPRVRGGIFAANDHRVDPRALTAALQVACERAGVKFVHDRAFGVETSGSGPTVMTEGSRFDAGAVVIASGARSGTIQLPREVSVPVRPVKGQVVKLKTKDGAFARRNIRGLEAYVVSRADGRVVIGATVEERGFDESVTAEAVFELLRSAYELLPGIVELEFQAVEVGFRPGTPDNQPLLGESAVDGVILATGHFRNGILLAPVTGDAIAAIVAGETDERIAPFSPLRFGERVT